MATLNENITRIEGAKVAIKNAIIGKGVAVEDTALLDTYASKIEMIPTSGGGGGNLDLTGTGWEVDKVFPVNVGRLSALKDDLDYTRQKYSEWDPSESVKVNKYANDENLIYAPRVNIGTSYSVDNLFYYCTNLYAVPTLDFSKVERKDYAAGIFRDCENLTYITALNTAGLTNFTLMFGGCKTLPTIPMIDTSSATNLYSMFAGCYKLVSVPKFDTSKVTDMRSCFDTCEILASVPKFNTSNVTKMGSCFRNCHRLTEIPLFDTSKVIDMQGMFEDCWDLISIPPLNTSKVTNMYDCFSRCSKLTTVPKLDLSLATEMSGCFYGCESLTNLGGFTGLKVSLSLIFGNSLTHQSLLNVFNELATVTDSPKISLSTASKNILTEAEIAIATDKGWVVS